MNMSIIILMSITYNALHAKDAITCALESQF